MPEISIIVPVYKVEQYLSHCLDSILAQSFTDFELLLIDDGTPDNCGKICDEYAEKDGRIRVFHKENGGVSSARNLGLDNAAGKYIMFCDGDDEVEPFWVETLYSSIIDTGLLVGISNYSIIFSDFKEKKEMKSNFNSTLPLNHYLELRLAQLDQYVWNKIFIKSIIEEHHLRFDSSISYGEDNIFVLNYLQFCVGGFAINNKCTYRYRINMPGSLTHKYIPNLWDYYERILSEREKIIELFECSLIGKESQYAQSLMWSCNFSINNYLYDSCPLSQREKRKQILRITRSKYYSYAVSQIDLTNTNLLKRITVRSGSPTLIMFHKYLTTVKAKIKKKY